MWFLENHCCHWIQVYSYFYRAANFWETLFPHNPDQYLPVSLAIVQGFDYKYFTPIIS